LEVDYAPIDVKDLFRCGADGPADEDAPAEGDAGGSDAGPPELRSQQSIPEEPENEPQPFAAGPAPVGIDVRELLQASAAMAKQRSVKAVRPEKAFVSPGRVFRTVRWAFAIFFGLVG